MALVITNDRLGYRRGVMIEHLKEGKVIFIRATKQERKLACPTTHPANRFEYLIGEMQPNYPLPAIRQRTFESLLKLGYSSAENSFPIDVVFDNYIKY